MGAAEEQLIRAYFQGFNQRDAIDAASFFAEDALSEEFALDSVVHGLEGIQKILHSMAQTDVRIDIDRLFSTTEHACVEWTMSGTYSFKWLGFPPTGKRFSVRGVTAIDLAGGKIRRYSDYWDFASLLRQVGLLSPTPN
jgi:steroid delta-isomerase-like uncharacterized protein